MALLDPAPPAAADAAPPTGRDALLRPPFDTLDDAALLAHFRAPRGIRFEARVDAEEIPPARIAGVMAGRFEFNGETHALPDPVDWLANPSSDIEWHILLHKFYYAVGLAEAWRHSGDAAYARRWAQLIDRWIATVPPGFIATDVTGRRVQHWIYSLQHLVFDGAGAPVDAAFFRRLLHALHGQVEHLCAHLTPKRNHRTLELLAILLAGVALPEFGRAAHWRAFALAESAANLQADLLADGVHCELSTDYHHLALRNWMQVRQLAADNGLALPPGMDAALERAFGFSLHVHQPGGGLPSLSDGDARGYGALLALGAQVFGRADLLFAATGGARGQAPAARVAHFPVAGYHVVRSGWPAAPAAQAAQHLVFDCGPLGEGNHGHFDALSFELAAFGRPLVVDPGRYTYSEAGATNWRLHFRGTAAHNTVCVDGRDQTLYLPKPVKGASRHASGAVRHKVSGPAPDCSLLDAAHADALDLLHGRAVSHVYDAVHTRCIVFVDRCYWIVVDRLRAPTPHHYALRFQLGAPAQGQCTLAGDGLQWQLRSPGLAIAQRQGPGQQAVIDSAWVSARYGHKQPAPALLTSAHGCDADFATVLLPLAGDDGTMPDLQPHGLLPARALHPDGRALPLLQIRLPRPDGGVWLDTWFQAEGDAPGPWVLGPLHFTGRWLHCRHGEDGRLLRALSHAGAQLHGPLGPVALLHADAPHPVAPTEPRP